MRWRLGRNRAVVPSFRVCVGWLGPLRRFKPKDRFDFLLEIVFNAFKHLGLLIFIGLNLFLSR